jgi:hypothetical protein
MAFLVECVFEEAERVGAIFVWDGDGEGGSETRSIDYDRLAPLLTPSGRTNVQGLIDDGKLKKLPVPGRTFLVPGPWA